MKLLFNITAGNPRRLIKPVIFTMLANIVNILPFALLALAAKLLFEPFIYDGQQMDFASLRLICIGMVISLLLVYLAEIPAYRSQFREAYHTAAEGRAALAEHLRKLPLGYLNRRDPGDLANMMMGDFTLIEHGISHLVPQMIGAAVMPVIAFAGLLFIDWRMALAMFAAFPISLLLLLISSKLQRRLGSAHMEAKIDAGNRLQEYLSGIRVIKAYNLTGARFKRLELAFRELMKRSIQIESTLGPIVLSAIACIRAGLTVMVFAGVHLLLGGKLDITVFVMFLIVGTRIFDPLTTALVGFAEFRYHAQAGERIAALLQEQPLEGSGQTVGGYNISFDQVTFGYKNKIVLKNISAEMKEGTLTALVGPSGSGKSTMLRLIARFYDTNSGSVRFNKQDIKEVHPEALLANISMVFQDVYLFQDTIANNIRFGRADASMDEVKEAAKRALCHDFIMNLPDGYNTMVGEGGCTLSGGEKQRISIARALLKDAPILLLDEATASLDPENEAEIQKAINELVKGRTVIVVAHRLKTIAQADQIYVLDEGEIIEQGTHNDLIGQNGVYAKLWGLQQQAAKWRIGSNNTE